MHLRLLGLPPVSHAPPQQFPGGFPHFSPVGMHALVVVVPAVVDPAVVVAVVVVDGARQTRLLGLPPEHDPEQHVLPSTQDSPVNEHGGAPQSVMQ